LKIDRQYRFQQLLKRSIDLAITIPSLLLLTPVLIAIAIAIRLDSRGSIFFIHQRVGMNGKPFRMYKFRTMKTGASDSKYMEYLRQLIASEDPKNEKALPYRKLTEDPRITQVGRFLRRFYLDELPQLINILKGEMSLVGPRPHVQFEVDHYDNEQRRRLSARPGVTGLWQATGKVDSSFNELIALDLEYIDNWNLQLDFWIILTTLSVIFRGGEKIWRNATNKPLPFHKRLSAAIHSDEKAAVDSYKPK
jgi:lipopolysaccharide/colanic/teichoic acid biosynthesis glycosyltransferase